MAFNMVAYKGGSMSQSGTNFNNSGGVRVNPEDLDYTVVIDTHQGNGSFRTGGYEHVATLTYDRVKHSASVKVYAAIATRSSTPIVKSAKEFSQSVIIGYDDTGKPIYR